MQHRIAFRSSIYKCISLEKLNQKITNCRACPRLVAWREEVAEKKVRRYSDQQYWGKPVPGFGDPEARVLLIGLAPAAHGANRTGRMFTGDKSGEWLYKALYENGFSNHPESHHQTDNLRLQGAFITALIRCAPPQNKPIKEEISNCKPYLNAEIEHLSNIRIVITLGRLAFENYCRMKNLRGMDFAHGKMHFQDSGPHILCSYHPSRQNTNTGRLKWPEWNEIFVKAREFASN